MVLGARCVPVLQRDRMDYFSTPAAHEHAYRAALLITSMLSALRIFQHGLNHDCHAVMRLRMLLESGGGGP